MALSLAPRARPKHSVRVSALRGGLMLLPVLLLLLAAMRASAAGLPALVLWLLTGAQVILSVLVFRSRRLATNPLGSTVLLLYVIAAAGLPLGQGIAGQYDWYSRFAQGLLFLMGTIFFARLVIAESGL